MTFLTLFVVIPVVMLLALWLARNDSQVRGVMVVGSTALLALAIYLVLAFVNARETMPAEQYPFLSARQSLGLNRSTSIIEPVLMASLWLCCC